MSLHPVSRSLAAWLFVGIAVALPRGGDAQQPPLSDPAFDPNSPAGLVFTIELSEGTGYGSNSTYEVTFVQPIDDGSGFVFDDFSTAPAGQNDWIGLDADA